MTRPHLTWITVLSLLATALVLTAGASGTGTGGPVPVAERVPVTVAAPAVAGAGDELDDPDGTDTGEDATGDETSGEDDGGSHGAGSAEPAAEDQAGRADDGEGTARPGGTTAGDERLASKIGHVFLIVLAGHGFDATFGAGSAAAYLNGTLRPKGALLTDYHALGPGDLPDELAMIGGQPPNADTRAGCPVFREIPPTSRVGRDGTVTVDGCVYPNTVTTLGDQLTAGRHSWRAYVEDLEKDPSGTGGRQTCRHPGSGAADETLRGRPGDGYATRHNPFVYYHSLLDLGDCDAKVGGLDGLEGDLKTARSTPSFSFIAPNLCHDGTESPCADGSPGGLAAADAFLAAWAPRILASPAYRDDGLLIVAFAGDARPPEAGEAGGAGSDAPVRNGLLLVSRYARAGASAGSDYDPYSLLRSIEDLFGLRPLARAATASSFAATVLADALAAPPSDG